VLLEWLLQVLQILAQLLQLAFSLGLFLQASLRLVLVS
jgi:hypothetical protein